MNLIQMGTDLPSSHAFVCNYHSGLSLFRNLPAAEPACPPWRNTSQLLQQTQLQFQRKRSICAWESNLHQPEIFDSTGWRALRRCGSRHCGGFRRCRERVQTCWGRASTPPPSRHPWTAPVHWRILALPELLKHTDPLRQRQIFVVPSLESCSEPWPCLTSTCSKTKDASFLEFTVSEKRCRQTRVVTRSTKMHSRIRLQKGANFKRFKVNGHNWLLYFRMKEYPEKHHVSHWHEPRLNDVMLC